MIQSMSRVAHFIDNGLKEGFLGIFKRERYYGWKFHNRSSIISMIEEYIAYYNNRRIQRNLELLTPMEKHAAYIKAA